MRTKRRTKSKMMSLDTAVALLERDHGGCDQNTCTISVALRHGYPFVALDSWIGSGAASAEFNGAVMPFSFKDVRAQSAEMCRVLPHVECPSCNAVLWCPEEQDYYCDSCGKDIPRPKGGDHAAG